MSTHVVGFQPPDEEWARKKAAWDACAAAGVAPPQELEDFFDGEEPDDRGREVAIPAHVWSDNRGRAGFEVVLSELPPKVKIVRFYNSW